MSNRPDAEDLTPHQVYRCYDAKGRLLYVGCTRDLDARFTLHNPLVVRHMVELVTETHPNRLAGRAAERAAIEAESPLLNKQHNPTRFKKRVGGGYDPVEPIHPLTAELIRQSKPASMDDMRAAMLAVSNTLRLGAA